MDKNNVVALLPRGRASAGTSHSRGSAFPASPPSDADVARARIIQARTRPAFAMAGSSPAGGQLGGDDADATATAAVAPSADQVRFLERSADLANVLPVTGEDHIGIDVFAGDDVMLLRGMRIKGELVWNAAFARAFAARLLEAADVAEGKQRG